MNRWVIVALLVAGIGSVTGLEVCAIDCTHGYEFTADPVNCKNYYVCRYNDYLYPIPCDGNQFFDIVSHSCKDSNYTCTPECEKCSFDCAAPGLDKRASTIDCGVYFTCSTAEWTTCPLEAPYFNGDICQTDPNNCCACKPYCTQTDADNHFLVPDVLNCTNYYLCLEAGIPDETSQGHCPSGNFDPSIQQCVENITCIPGCAGTQKHLQRASLGR